MTVRRWIFACGLAALLVVSLLTYIKPNRESPLQPAGQDESLEPVRLETRQVTGVKPVSAAAAEPVIRINATSVLDSVNGRQLSLADLVPLNPAQSNQEQELSPVAYSYLLDRAVNRELIFQTAKARGIALDDSQREQLSQFRGERMQQGPGLVKNLNADSTRMDFEIRDAEAFMLQTTLLAVAGASPDVNAEDARDYYNRHAAEFGALPPDEPARSEAWVNIEYQIRTLLAPFKRSTFQGQLTSYMDQLKSGANITLTPVDQSGRSH